MTLREELEKCGMTKLYREIELPLCPVLYRMENRGIAIDRNQLEQFGTMLGQRIDDCENLKTVYAPAGSYAEQWATQKGYKVINY